MVISPSQVVRDADKASMRNSDVLFMAAPGMGRTHHAARIEAGTCDASKKLLTGILLMQISAVLRQVLTMAFSLTIVSEDEMTNRENYATRPIELTAPEVAAVSGGTPWEIFRSLSYQGSLADLSSPQGFQAWDWKQYYRLYVTQMESGAPLAPGLATLAARYGFAERFSAR